MESCFVCVCYGSMAMKNTIVFSTHSLSAIELVMKRGHECVYLVHNIFDKCHNDISVLQVIFTRIE